LEEPQNAALSRLVPQKIIGTMPRPNDLLYKSCGFWPTLLLAPSMGESGTKATDESGTDAAAANQIFWFSANPYTGSRRHPKLLSIKSFLVKGVLVAQYVERSSRQLVGQGLDGDHILGFSALALMKGFRAWRIAHRKVGRLDIGPR
jgi:hypothetical protein